VARFLMVGGALVRRRKGLATVFQRVEQAAMPRIARLEADFEAEAAVGIYSARLPLRRSYCDPADKIAVTVTRAQLLFGVRPVGRNPTAAYDVVRLDSKMSAKSQRSAISS
jgi:hypothetical protein